MGGIRFCEQCGSPLPPGSKFCENCGAPVLDETQSKRTERGRRSSETRPREESQGSRRAPAQRSTAQRRASGPAQGSSTPRRTSGPAQGSSTQRRPSGMSQGGEAQRRPSGMPQGNEFYSRTPDPARMRQAPRRRENPEGDWQQSWQREQMEDERSSMTPIQYVLIGLTVVLLIALIVFAVFWILGRSSDRDTDSRLQAQTETAEEARQTGEEQTEAPVTILDQTEAQTAVSTEAPTERQTETEAADIVLEYQEFTVTLPGSWQGKYGITQGADYYTFYQQASKARGYSGTLFTITRYTDTSYQNLPNYQVLGTGNQAAFVFQLPTDVQYAADDAAVAQEYQTMAADLNTISSNIRILVSGEGPRETEPVEIIQQTDAPVQTQPSGSGYIAESSQRAVTEADVSGMSYNDLQMAINEIYARHGRRFSDPDIQSYFDSQPWYQGTIEPDAFDTSVFSSTESQNIQYLLDRMAGLQ